MNGRRAKWLSKQIIEFNPYVYTTIQEHMGALTKERQPRTLYRIAKRLWSKKAKGTENWKKDFKSKKVKKENR